MPAGKCQVAWATSSGTVLYGYWWLIQLSWLVGWGLSWRWETKQAIWWRWKIKRWIWWVGLRVTELDGYTFSRPSLDPLKRWTWGWWSYDEGISNEHEDNDINRCNRQLIGRWRPLVSFGGDGIGDWIMEWGTTRRISEYFVVCRVVWVWYDWINKATAPFLTLRPFLGSGYGQFDSLMW